MCLTCESFFDMRRNNVGHPKICLFLDIDYFKLVMPKKQKTQEEPLTFPPKCLKEF